MLYFRAPEGKSFPPQGDVLSSEVLGTDSAPAANAASTGIPQDQGSLRHDF